MLRDPRVQYDGCSTLEAGVNSGTSPSLLPRNQCSWAQNVRMRGGYPRSRPGFNNRAFAFASQDDADTFLSGKFQGFSSYYATTGRAYLIWSVDGRIWSCNLEEDYAMTDITPASGANSDVPSKAYFQQAERYLIIQDGQEAAIIYDGTQCQRSQKALRQVPTGTVMAYGMGRLWVALGRNFAAGDIVGGPSGTAVNNFEDAVLYFTENDYLNEGGSFTFPLPTGDITALRFIALQDTSLGQGPLLVFTPGAIASVQAPVDRTTWKNLTYPIQTVSQISYGAEGDRSTLLVNGDVFYRASDGIRSYIQAVRQFFDWGNTPVSHEMERILAKDTQSLLKFSSAVLFDNRLLMTASPVAVPNSCYHQCLVSLDFEGISSMRQKTGPAYDGIWTGVNVLQLQVVKVQGNDRCFAAVRNAVGEIELWEISLNDNFDNQGTENTRIDSVIEYPSFNYPATQPSPAPTLKRLERAEFWIDEVVGQVDFTVKYRPDQYPCWVDYETFDACATFQDCTADPATCLPFKQYQPQYRTRIILGQPPDDTDSVDNKPMRLGYEHQVRLEWTGRARIKVARIAAYEEQEAPYDGRTP